VALNKQIETGATIINCSWGNANVDPRTATTYKKYFKKMAQDHPDVLFVCSGGNTGTALDGARRIPSGLALPNMITVGAVDNDGTLIDRFSSLPKPVLSHEGFRIWWFHSTRKAQLDAVARAGRINRATTALTELQDRLYSPKARIRTKEKATEAVTQILRQHGVVGLFAVTITERQSETFRQERRGRPTKGTRYVRKMHKFCSMEFTLNEDGVARERASDGVFPLITNVESLTAIEVLEAYKKQPLVEKRFSQLKTDFRVAPVYLKSVRRIEALLCIYFFVLMTQALLERELRRAMERTKADSVPLYPERRKCRRPTARLLIDLFDGVERHTLEAAGRKPLTMVTALSRAQRRILKLLRIPPSGYGR